MKTLQSAAVCLAIALLARPSLARDSEAHPPAPREHHIEDIFTADAIDDDALIETITAASVKMLKDGTAVKMTELMKGLSLRQCVACPCPPSTEKLASTDLVSRYRPAVVVIANPFKCKDCSRTHIATATGFFIASDGVIATCRHVVSSPDDKTVVVMTGDGRILPVREVIASDEVDDVALLKVEGANFIPLPLVEVAPPGTRVRVFSHPDEHFYSITEGHISRYSLYSEEGRKKTRVMTITADFAKGSSGGPVLDDFGNVVGMVASTESIYYDDDAKGKQTDLQMVFKHCTPAAAILKLLKRN